MAQRRWFPGMVWWLSVLSWAGVLHAQEKRVTHPAAPALQRFEPIEPNPFFIQDPDDPRVLLPSDDDEGRIIDRRYIERMVRGHIPRETLDALEAVGVPRPTALPHPSTLTPQNPGFATVLSGNILVIEGDVNIAPALQGGRSFDHNGSGLQRVIQQVWQRLGDNYDFITVFTTFDDAQVAAYYLPLRQDTTGLGACNFNAGETFGCVFNQLGPNTTLQGFVFMNSLSYWDEWDRNYSGQTFDLNDFDASVYAVLGQEVGHRWGSGLRFQDPRTGAISKKLLGRDGSHWAAWVDTDASVMDGWDWTPPNDQGRYTLVGDMDGYSLLDRYAMGAVPVASPRPFFFIDDARYVPNQFTGGQSIPADAVLTLPTVEYMGANGITLQATGEQVDLTIQDIVNAEGVRCPDKDHTQKVFRQAVVLVTRPGETAAQASAAVARLESVLPNWEAWWADRTGHALTLCTGLGVPCEHPEVALGEGTIDTADGIVEPGDAFDLVIEAKSLSSRIYNARLLLRLSGNGAEATSLESAEISVGDIAPGAATTVKVPLRLAEEYGCGYSVIVDATLVSDNAEAITESYRIFPGYQQRFLATFDEDDDGFGVNRDGQDNASTGAMVRTDVTLTCTTTPRTPERDASPGGTGAFITAVDGELSGTTSLWSGEIDVRESVDPEIRFAYWLDGEGGKITVLVSRTGNGFTEAKVYDEPFHGWSLGRVVLRDVYPDDPPPEKLYVLFVVEGSGAVEAGIDDVRVLDPIGTCTPADNACGCASARLRLGYDGWSLLTIMGLLGLLLRRRRVG